MINIEVKSPIVNYNITINRKFTYIRGDSATGKTELVGILLQGPRDSHISIKSDKKLFVLNDLSWEDIILNLNDHVIFIDEDFVAYNTKEFAKAVKESDNYFVIINRASNEHIPYSYEEVYSFIPSGKYVRQVKKYDKYMEDILADSILITEDSNSGHQYFSHLYKNVISANGKSNIKNKIVEQDNSKPISVIADGAAFGSNIETMVELKKTRNIRLFLPESFEYMLLHLREFSTFLNSQSLSEIIKYNFNSWEQYFTQLITELSNDTQFKYTKSKINEYYLTDSKVKELVSHFPQIKYENEVKSFNKSKAFN